MDNWYYAPVSLRLEVGIDGISTKYLSGVWLQSGNAESPGVIMATSPLLSEYYTSGRGLASNARLGVSFEPSEEYHPSLMINLRRLERSSDEIDRFVGKNFTFRTAGQDYDRGSLVTRESYNNDVTDINGTDSSLSIISKNSPLALATIVLNPKVRPRREFAIKLNRVAGGNINTPITVLGSPFGHSLNHPLQWNGLITYVVKSSVDQSSVLLLSDAPYIRGMEGGLVIVRDSTITTTNAITKLWDSLSLKQNNQPPRITAIGIVAGSLRKNTGEGELLVVLPWSQILGGLPIKSLI